MKAVLLVSHGSRSRAARAEVEALAARLRAASGRPIVEIAFLDVEQPDIPAGVAACAAKGATEVTVLLNFLNSGNHVREDIPAILAEEGRKRPGLVLRLTPPVGTHPRIADLFLEILNAPPPA